MDHPAHDISIDRCDHDLRQRPSRGLDQLVDWHPVIRPAATGHDLSMESNRKRQGIEGLGDVSEIAPTSEPSPALFAFPL